MSEANPILLLMAGLAAAASAIVWGLGIYVAARVARRRRRPAWPWVLLAILPGPLVTGAGYAAFSRRRCPYGWAAAQAASIGLAALVSFPARRAMGIHLALDLLVLSGLALLAFGPLLALAILGPRAQPAADGAGDGALIRAVDLHKSYNLGGRTLKVLRGVSLSVRPGEFVAILGASGSGKSTLLHLLGLLDLPDEGELILDGADSRSFRPAERDRFRCRDVGFVFQFYHLLPELNVLENVLLPAMADQKLLRWAGARTALRHKAVEVLQRVGLGERMDHRPRQLSGGEQQRVAIARALVNSPKLLLADEPTGNLDSRTGGQIIKLLKQLNAETGQTIVMVTHDQALADMARRVLHLHDGMLK